MVLLLLLDLRELTTNRCKLRSRVAGQPRDLTCEQGFAILGQALEPAPLRPYALDLCTHLVGLSAELRCALLARQPTEARTSRNPRHADGPLLRDDDVSRVRALVGRARAEPCSVLVAAYEPHIGKRLRATMNLLGGGCRIIYDKRLDQ